MLWCNGYAQYGQRHARRVTAQRRAAVIGPHRTNRCAAVIFGDDRHDPCRREHLLLVEDLARYLKRTPTAVAERMINLHGAHSESGYPGTRWHFTKLDRKAADRQQGD